MSYNTFIKCIQRIFKHYPKIPVEQLLSIMKGNLHATMFTLEFRTYTTGSKWNELALTMA